MSESRIPDLGIVQWFRFEERNEVLLNISLLKELGIRKIRTAISWADWEREGGTLWFDWLISTLFEAGFEILPALFYTPAMRAALLPGQTRNHARTCFPPARVNDYADFCEAIVIRYENKLGSFYQLWNEQNNDAYWSPVHDPSYLHFSQMAHLAIDVFKKYGKGVVLGGIIPPYLSWLELPAVRSLILRVDVIGIHAFPGTWDKMVWHGWQHAIQMVRSVIGMQEVWITETGFSTVDLHDQTIAAQEWREKEQVSCFGEACVAPADQIFWYSLKDQDLDHPTDNFLNRGTANDPRAYYFGLVGREGKRKPLFEHWKTRSVRCFHGEGFRIDHQNPPLIDTEGKAA